MQSTHPILTVPQKCVKKGPFPRRLTKLMSRSDRPRSNGWLTGLVRRQPYQVHVQPIVGPVTTAGPTGPMLCRGFSVHELLLGVSALSHEPEQDLPR